LIGAIVTVSKILSQLLLNNKKLKESKSILVRFVEFPADKFQLRLKDRHGVYPKGMSTAPSRPGLRCQGPAVRYYSCARLYGTSENALKTRL
jgi:hypothetical protein